jgi:hypothetical protein
MKRFRSFTPLLFAAALPLLAVEKSNIPAVVERGMQLFSADAMKAHDKFLASDLLEGRGPGTRGDELARQYIASQFESYGLEPAGDNGTFIQRVPLLGVRMDGANTLSFVKEGAPAIGPLKYLDEFVGTDQSQSPSSTITSSSFSSATATSRRNIDGMTTKDSTHAARRSSCSSMIRRRTRRNPISSKAKRARTTGGGRTSTRSAHRRAPTA